jgi:hypothetical protein
MMAALKPHIGATCVLARSRRKGHRARLARCSLGGLFVFWALAGAACDSEPSPPRGVVPVSVHNGITTLLAPAGAAAMAEEIAASLTGVLPTGFPLVIDPQSLLAGTAGTVVVLDVAQGMAEVKSASLELSSGADTGAFAVELALRDIGVTVPAELLGLAGCDVRWQLASPVLALGLDGARDKSGAIRLVLAGSPRLRWESLTVDLGPCAALDGSDGPSLAGAIGSTVLNAVRAQLEGGLSASLLGPAEEWLATTAAGRSRLERERASGEKSEVVAELVAAVPDNSTPAISVDAAGAWMPLDLAMVSDPDPCVPATELPPPAVVPIPVLGPEALGEGTGYAVLISRVAIEQAAAHLFRAGFFCSRSGAAPPLLSGALDPHFSALRAFVADTPLHLRIRPAKAPALSVPQGTNGLVALFEGMVVDVYAVLDGAAVRLSELRVDARVSLLSTFRVDGSLAVRVGLVEVSDVSWLQAGLPATPEAPDAAAALVVEAALVDLFADKAWALPALPAGIAVQGATASWLEDSHLVLRFPPQPGTAPR